MPSKPPSPTAAAKPRRRPAAGLLKPGVGEDLGPMMSELRLRAETRMLQQRKSAARGPKPKAHDRAKETDAQRTLHELQVHQIELEMQNSELLEARNRTEVLLEKYTDLYDFAPVGYFSLDEQGRIQEVNLSGAAMLGVERSRLADGSFSRFVAPASRPDFLAFLKRVFAGTGQEICDLALIKEDATDFWARFRGTAAISAREQRKWCRVSMADITVYRQAEEALRDSEARFHVMADAIPQLTWQARPDGFITWYNQRWYEYTGTTPEPMEGWGWQTVHDPEVLPKVQKRWKASLATGKPFDMTFPLRGADGVLRQFLTRAVPHKDNRGRVLQWFGTNTDIEDQQRAAETQRRLEVLAASNQKLELEIVRRQLVEDSLKKSERQLSQSLAQARQQQEQLRQLARKIIDAQEEERKRISRELHDEIAQTLVGMNVHLEALAREGKVDPASFKQKIVRTQKLIGESVDVVHRFARDLRPTLLDDLGLIPALHSYLKEFTERTKVRVHFKAFAGVEGLSSHRRTVLYRVAQSALSNIAQHAQATDVKVSITNVRHIACLEIHDNGKSFDVEKVLFANRYKRLGLIGTRERVEMIGGTFSVESSPGHGTTIRAKIPYSPPGKSGKESRKTKHA